jgi:uncharacterized membrane protein
MDSAPVPPAEAAPSSRFVTLRNAFFSGLLLLAPLIVTVWALTRIVDLVGGTFRPLFFFYLPPTLTDHAAMAIAFDLLATLIVLALITGLGYVSRDVFGKYLVAAAERVMQRIPGLGAVYNTVKQVADTFGPKNRQLLNKVVLVEFPRRGTWALGFLTSKVQGEAQEKTASDVWTVYVPTTPIPTSGFLILVPRSDIIELELTTGEGMKMIISGGAVVPPWPPSSSPRVD